MVVAVAGGIVAGRAWILRPNVGGGGYRQPAVDEKANERQQRNEPHPLGDAAAERMRAASRFLKQH
jgi:hypothetical protein